MYIYILCFCFLLLIFDRFRSLVFCLSFLSSAPPVLADVHIYIIRLLDIYRLVAEGLCFVHATSTGDVYGQRVRVCRVGEGGDNSPRDDGKAVPATLRSALFSDRIQSM